MIRARSPIPAAPRAVRITALAVIVAAAIMSVIPSQPAAEGHSCHLYEDWKLARRDMTGMAGFWPVQGKDTSLMDKWTAALRLTT